MAAPTFADVLGQPRAVETLRRAVASGRLHHAWVFHGPDGVGKMLAARAFAGLLLDPTSEPNLAGEIEPDPSSETQRLLAAGSHPDLYVVTKELAAVSRNKQVREQKQRTIALEALLEFLIEPATRAASVSTASRARRVFLVDEAHLIAHEGHGALLKTLEEPAPGVVIVLVTEQDSDLPATIRSRCQRVPFGALPEADMRRWLARSGIETDSARTDWLLRFAAGSPGALLRAHEAGLFEWSGRLAPLLREMERGRYPAEFAPEVKALVSEDAERRAAKAGPNASKDAASKAAAATVFALLNQWARERVRACAGERSREDDARLRATDLIAEAERRLDWNANPEQVFDNLAAQLARAD